MHVSATCVKDWVFCGNSDLDFIEMGILPQFYLSTLFGSVVLFLILQIGGTLYQSVTGIVYPYFLFFPFTSLSLFLFLSFSFLNYFLYSQYGWQEFDWVKFLH